VLAAAALATHALAHDLPMSSIDLRVEPDALIARATAHVIDVAHDLGPAAPEDSLVDSAFLARNAAPIFDLVQSRISIETGGATLLGAPEGIAAHPEAQAITVTLRYPLERPAKQLEIEGLLFPYDARHLTLLDVRVGGENTHEDFFNRDQRRVRVRLDRGREILPVVRRFVKSGIHHIFIGPDHILFIVGLMLLGGSVGRLLKIVTGFTVAHSITLTLATLGLVTPPARLIEPMIALSIVFVGLDNLRTHRGGRDPRALLAFGFGFIHGFGFASVLRDFGIPPQSVGWALFSFNVGVEIGQICIVAAVAPIMELLRRRVPALATRVATAGSIVVACAGAWWFIERVFLSA
jgi:hypothetical protein